jgi:hypothetical protein
LPPYPGGCAWSLFKLATAQRVKGTPEEVMPNGS